MSQTQRIVLSAFGVLVILTLIYWKYREVRYGDVIGSDYVGEDTGYSKITLFENRYCKQEYGGIFGSTEVNYYSFKLDSNAITIQTEKDIYNLDLMKVELNGREYRLQTMIDQ